MPTDLEKVLKAEMQTRSSSSFEPLLQQWEKKHGVAAFLPLLHIAEDQKNPEVNRYVAFMSAAKLGGKESVPHFVKFLKDPSWMLRAGALRILTAYGSVQTGESFFPLLHDPALVVRMEAVEAIGTLKPSGAAEALVQVIKDPENFHRGHAFWVPQKALQKLVALRARQVVAQLDPLLRSPLHRADPEFLKQMSKTIELLRAQ